MEAVLIVILALLGTAVGSFLNVCIDRLPAGKSLAYPPSHCDACQHHLSVIDLVPVFSFLWLRRRCRYCQATIPWRVFWVELGTGLLFAFLYWHYGLSIELAVNAFYCCLFIVLGIIDLEHQLILNKITFPAAIAAVLISAIQPQPGIVHISLPWPEIANSVSGITNSLIGGAAGFVAFLIVHIISQGAVAAGDVKMAALIGLVVGFPRVFAALFMGIVLGGLVGGVLLLLKIKKGKDPLPSGSFLALATIVTLLWGSGILNWYLRFFS